MSKLGKIPYLFAGTLLVLSAFFAVAMPSFTHAAAATADVDVRLLYTPQGQTKYTYLDTPTSIGSSATELYITTRRSIRAFALSGAETEALDLAADRAYKNGNLTVTLENGELNAYFGDGKTTVTSGLDDFCAVGNKLYAYTNDTANGYAAVKVYSIEENNLVAGRSFPLQNTFVTAIAASDARVYLGVRAQTNGTRDYLCTLDESGILHQSGVTVPPIRKLLATSGNVYVSTENKITAYRFVNDCPIPAQELAVADVIDMTATDGRIFALTGAYGVLEIPVTLSGYAELLASASAQSGFFDTPYATVTRKNQTLVADYNNHRVARISDAGVSYLDYAFVYPTTAAIDDYGRVYVGHRINLIDVFDENGGHLYTVDLGDARVLDVFTDGTDDVFVRTDDMIGRLVDEKFETYYDGAVSAVSVMPESRSLYVYAGGTVSLIDEDGNSEQVARIAKTVVDFAVDLERSLYVLTDSGMIYKYTAADKYVNASAAVRYTGFPVTEGARRITISTIKSDGLDYGDLLVTDTKAHTVKAIDAQSFAVKVIDDAVKPPVDPQEPSPNPVYDDSIIFVAPADIAVYELPRDMSPFYTIASGRKIIVPQYAIADADAFCFVLIEDGDKQTLLSGYVRRFRLPESARIPYAAPPAKVGTVQNDNTVVYKWPSIYAPALEGYGNLAKGTDVTLLDFVTGFIDDSGYRWYRVAVGEGEGYIYAANLSVNHYQPIFIRPQYNAEIVATAERDTAVLYFVDGNGTYYEIENQPPLPQGTRVEVVGAFDPAKEYTQIKYFDENLGTLECYVKTEHLKYHGVSALQIVVFVLIGVMLILLIVLVVHHFVVRRKRINKL